MCPVIWTKTNCLRCTDSIGGAGAGVELGGRRARTAELTGGAADRAAPRFRWHPGVRGVAGEMLQLLPCGSACWGDLELAGQGSETWGRRAVLDSELSRDCQCAAGSGLLGYIG